MSPPDAPLRRMFGVLNAFVAFVLGLLRSRVALATEIAALRHPRAVIGQDRPTHAQLRRGDRTLWAFWAGQQVVNAFPWAFWLGQQVVNAFPWALWLGQQVVNAFPWAFWLGQQVVNAFPWDTAPRFMIRDRGGAFGQLFSARVRGLGTRGNPGGRPRPQDEP